MNAASQGWEFCVFSTSECLVSKTAPSTYRHGEGKKAPSQRLLNKHPPRLQIPAKISWFPVNPLPENKARFQAPSAGLKQPHASLTQMCADTSPHEASLHSTNRKTSIWLPLSDFPCPARNAPRNSGILGGNWQAPPPFSYVSAPEGFWAIVENFKHFPLILQQRGSAHPVSAGLPTQVSWVPRGNDR